MNRVSVIMLAAVLGVMFLLPTGISAQGLEGATVGLKGGLNLADVSSYWGDEIDSDPDHKLKLGASFGAFASVELSEYLALQPELLFTMKGVKLEDTEAIDSSSADTKLIWKLNYVEIPILAKIMIPVDGNLSPVLYAGPALGFLISADAETEVTINGETSTTEEDTKDFTKSFDLGVVFGGGIEYDTGQMKLICEVRYNLGLININDPEDDVDTIDLTEKNRALSFMVGVGFPI